jgi:probable HAF family extracellular repeat protein
MQDLGTLGTGSDAIALLVNERGQIVGESYINSQKSTYCNNAFGFALTTGAFIWELGEMKNLGSFGGSCTFAADLNNQGVVVGLSTSPGDTFQHAFLWDGSLHELPNTVGGNDAAAIAINEAGDVVGWASVSGSFSAKNLVEHASLWKNGIMTDLGTLGTDPCSNGFSVNAAKQVVGISVAAGVHPPCNFDQTRAFLWQNGSIVDLNTLIPADSSLYLTSPETINDRGEIAGVGVDISTGNQHAFLLIPCAPDDTACQDAAAGPAFRPAPAITKSASSQNNVIRRILRRRLGPMYKAQGSAGGNLSQSVATPDNVTSNMRLNSASPKASLSPTSLAFSSEPVGTPSSAQLVTLSNNGNGTLNIVSITISANFGETNDCGSTVAPKASCTISVTFTPRLRVLWTAHFRLLTMRTGARRPSH